MFTTAGRISIREAIDLDLQACRRRQQRRNVQPRPALLTVRERRVLGCLLAGKTGKNAAYELGISPKTVDFHRVNILEKVGVNSLLELVRMID